jgi:glutathione synthase/RimK-type ligase-like ATP-grasp enzyme
VTKALGAPTIVEEGHRKTAYTQRLETTDLRDLRGVELTVHQFQHWVPKSFEARVVVVGSRCFAAGIYASSSSARVDWRTDYSALRYERVEPPPSVADGVVQYCTALGLVYGAFDFVVRPDGEWVFLECNPGGQYGWLERHVDLPITDALADLLTSGQVA